MRLLFVHAARTWSGSSAVFAQVARAMASRGYTVSFAAPEGSEVARLAQDAGAPVVTLEERRGIWRDARRLREILDGSTVDTVFVHDDHEHLVAAMAMRRLGRGALVRRVQAGGEPSSTWRAKRAERLTPTRYLYTSQAPASGHAVPSGRLAPTRAELGVDLPQSWPALSTSGEVWLACMASVDAIRRATNVIRAVAYLAQRHEALRLRVIGSAAADPDLKVLASALGIGRRVEWIPHAPNVSAVLHDVAAGWVIADGDDAGLGVLHLMANGIVALAERTSVAARYVSHGIHGILLGNLDPPLMAAETSVLLADPERRRTMGAAGRARVEREFTLREMLVGFEHTIRVARDRATPR